MIQTLIKNSWLLALGGVLDAIISVIYFSYAGQGFHATSPVVFLGRFTLAAGACTIAAGIWTSSSGKSWLLVLNGLACSALGLILTFWTGPLSFRTVALLIVLMAMSIGIYELPTARTSRVHLAGEWLLGAARVASLGFALAFLAFGFGWIKLEPEPGSPGKSLIWLACYFCFSAIFMLGLALRRNNLGAAIHRTVSSALPTG